jgi:RNA polymerase sigma factor for flagellar operon FliA
VTPDELISSHLGLAHSLALQVWRTAPHALEADELRAIANLGLVGAAKRWHAYCAENEYSADAIEYFRPFMVRRVHGALIDAIRQADWAKRSLRARAKALQEAGQEKGLTDAQLAERSGMTVEEVRATIRDMAARPVSLEGEEIDPATRHNVESSVMAQTLLGEVVNTVRRLPAEQQVVIALHYHRGLQLKEVAQILRITESRASQLHARAVLAIHHALVAAAEHREQ